MKNQSYSIFFYRVDQVMQYNFSTAEESREIEMQDDIFSSLMSECNRTTSGPMHGYGMYYVLFILLTTMTLHTSRN